MTENRGDDGLDQKTTLRAVGRFFLRWYSLHRIAFVALNGTLTLINIATGPPWWALWPLLVTGLLFCTHWFVVLSIKADERWADQRAADLQERSYDQSHIEDIIDRRVAPPSRIETSKPSRIRKSD